MRDIGKNIRDLRTQAGLSQDQLAEQLFVTRQTISNYETGRTRPDLDQLLRIAELFGTDANAVLYGPPIPPSRRKARLRTGVGCGLTAGIYLLYHLLLPAAEEIKNLQYSPFRAAVLAYIVRPLYLLLLGWSLVQLLSLVVALKPPEQPWARYLRWMLLAAAICGIGIPAALFCFAATDLLSRIWGTIRPIAYMLIQLNGKRAYLYPLLGAFLRLLDLPHS